MSASTERPFRLDHLDHVVLRVRDLEKSVAFYEMLGGESGGPRPAGTAMRITPNQTIILQERPEYTPAEVSAIDHINLAIQGQSIQDVTAYLRANGAELVREANGGDTVRVLDPDRHVIEIRMLRDS